MKNQKHNEKEAEFLCNLLKMPAQERRKAGYLTISEYAGELAIKEMRGEVRVKKCLQQSI